MTFFAPSHSCLVSSGQICTGLPRHGKWPHLLFSFSLRVSKQHAWCGPVSLTTLFIQMGTLASCGSVPPRMSTPHTILILLPPLFLLQGAPCSVRLGAWRRPAFPSCGRLKEDSRYIFFMEPDANSSGRAPAAFRASFPPLETGRNLKKEVSRVLCKRCGKSLALGASPPAGGREPGAGLRGPTAAGGRGLSLSSGRVQT